MRDGSWTIDPCEYAEVRVLAEALELQAALPSALGGPGLVLLGVAASALGMTFLSARLSRGRTGVTGLALALLASGALQPVLYKVNPRDGAVFVGVIITLAVASLVATFLPARRVTKIDPVVALVVE